MVVELGVVFDEFGDGNGVMFVGNLEIGIVSYYSFGVGVFVFGGDLVCVVVECGFDFEVVVVEVRVVRFEGGEGNGIVFVGYVFVCLVCLDSFLVGIVGIRSGYEGSGRWCGFFCVINILVNL